MGWRQNNACRHPDHQERTTRLKHPTQPGPSQEPQGTMGPTVRPDPTQEPEGTMRQWTRGLGRCTSRELQGCFPAKRVAHNQGDRKLHMYLPHCQQQRDSRKEQNVCHWHGGDRRGRRCERSDP
ncbi:hypothetical protein Bbelb_109080 [Branchiostoma belcheri]|nr:hypothetical protein Bbelb_109080 [Branchiostoma belcheri]